MDFRIQEPPNKAGQWVFLRGINDRRSAAAFANSRDQEAIYSTCLEVFRPRSRS
jgi:hypothetical protein